MLITFFSFQSAHFQSAIYVEQSSSAENFPNRFPTGETQVCLSSQVKQTSILITLLYLQRLNVANSELVDSPTSDVEIEIEVSI